MCCPTHIHVSCVQNNSSSLVTKKKGRVCLTQFTFSIVENNSGFLKNNLLSYVTGDLSLEKGNVRGCKISATDGDNKVQQ